MTKVSTGEVVTDDLTEIRRIADAMLIGKVADINGVLADMTERTETDRNTGDPSYETHIQSRFNEDTQLKEYNVSVARGYMFEPGDRRTVIFDADLNVLRTGLENYLPETGYPRYEFSDEEQAAVIDDIKNQLYVDIPSLASSETQT